MAWRIVVQPNGKYARFSTVADNFTDYDMTKDEAFVLCRDASGVDVANYKIEQADKHPDRFDREIDTIRDVHGNDEADLVRRELSI